LQTHEVSQTSGVSANCVPDGKIYKSALERRSSPKICGSLPHPQPWSGVHIRRVAGQKKWPRPWLGLPFSVHLSFRRPCRAFLALRLVIASPFTGGSMRRRTIFLVLTSVLASMGATQRTPNFVVTAPTPQIATQVGQYAEQYRREKAQLWLGEEMPQWPQP